MECYSQTFLEMATAYLVAFQFLFMLNSKKEDTYDVFI